MNYVFRSQRVDGSLQTDPSYHKVRNLDDSKALPTVHHLGALRWGN